MIIFFYNLQEDKILSNQHLLDAIHIKRIAFDVLLLKILYLVQKTLYQVFILLYPYWVESIFFFILLLYYLFNKEMVKQNLE